MGISRLAVLRRGGAYLRFLLPSARATTLAVGAHDAIVERGLFGCRRVISNFKKLISSALGHEMGVRHLMCEKTY